MSILTEPLNRPMKPAQKAASLRRKIERSRHTLKNAPTSKMTVTSDVSPLRQTRLGEETRSDARRREIKWRKCMGIE